MKFACVQVEFKGKEGKLWENSEMKTKMDHDREEGKDKPLEAIATRRL